VYTVVVLRGIVVGVAPVVGTMFFAFDVSVASDEPVAAMVELSSFELLPVQAVRTRTSATVTPKTRRVRPTIEGTLHEYFLLGGKYCALLSARGGQSGLLKPTVTSMVLVVPDADR
jgi:hypothetical protein